jgi:hypothetical protein
LYQEGTTRQQQHKQIARFFTPKAVSANCRQGMEVVSDHLVEDLRRTKHADLSAMSLTLASLVVAAVLGLQQSRVAGMDRRFAGFVKEDLGAATPWLQKVVRDVRSLWRVVLFYLLDVQPAGCAARDALAAARAARRCNLAPARARAPRQ